MIVLALVIGFVPAAAALAVVVRLVAADEAHFWRQGLPDVLGLCALAVVLAAGSVALLRVAAAHIRPRPASHEQQVERLVAEARTDSLTQLGNRRAFFDDLAAEIERRNAAGATFSLMAIDLDGLKEINDTRGHLAGDAHLRTMGALLQAQVGSRGRVYRTGGDEFMVLLPRTRNLHAIELAHRIQGATRSSAGKRVVSIGVTETTGTEHRQELVRQADVALYEAKREGLPVVPYQPGLDASEPGVAASRGARKHALAAALHTIAAARDPQMSVHAERVADLAVAAGKVLGIRGVRLDRLWTAALLHDVGKLAVADAILLKPGRLAPEERDLMLEHVSLGRDLLAAAGFPEEGEWILHHHEHVDGRGYPGGLRGRQIPLESSLIAVADAYHAMTGPRTYRPSLTPAQALAELEERSGTQFDPDCVRALGLVVRGTTDPPERRLANRAARMPVGGASG